MLQSPHTLQQASGVDPLRSTLFSCFVMHRQAHDGFILKNSCLNKQKTVLMEGWILV